MNCPKCQAEAADTARFCPECRADLDALRATGALEKLPEAAAPLSEDEKEYGPGWDFRYSWRLFVEDLRKVIAFVGLTTLIVSMLCVYYFPDLRLWFSGGVLVGALLLVSVVSSAFRAREEILPWIAPPAFLVEHGDIQFRWSAPTEPQRRGEIFLTRLEVQNCVNRTRSVCFTFELTPPANPKPALRFPKKVEAKLGPGEIVQIDVPLVVSPAPPPLIELWLTPDAYGPRGRRVRYSAAREFEPRVTDTETVLTALVGAAQGGVSISAGGGVSLRPRWWNDREPGNDWERELPPVSVKVLDTPDRELLLRAAK